MLIFTVALRWARRGYDFQPNLFLPPLRARQNGDTSEQNAKNAWKKFRHSIKGASALRVQCVWTNCISEGKGVNICGTAEAISDKKLFFCTKTSGSCVLAFCLQQNFMALFIGNIFAPPERNDGRSLPQRLWEHFRRQLGEMVLSTEIQEIFLICCYSSICPIRQKYQIAHQPKFETSFLMITGYTCMADQDSYRAVVSGCKYLPHIVG